MIKLKNLVQAALFCLVILLFMSAPTTATLQKAPDWIISEWINGPGVTLNDLKGQVVVVDFFQLWCPGCNQYSIPLMKKWADETFRTEIKLGKIKLISIHTVFEGHDYQTPSRLRAFVVEKEMKHLVGIDKHKAGERLPETMKNYRTRGTPEMAIIDKNGYIRFQRLGKVSPKKLEPFIRYLIDEPLQK